MDAGAPGRGRRLLRQVPGALLLVWLSMASIAAWAGCQLTQMEIPVWIVDQRPIATLKLNGTEVPMLVDSGAFFSSLSASTAAQLKLPLRNLPFGFHIEGYTGPVDSEMTRVEKVGLLGTELNNIGFLVGGNELGAGIMGVLGRNILSVADTEYDLAHGVVRLSFPKGECGKTNLAYWAGEAPVIVAPLTSSRRHPDTGIRLDVSINGTQTPALLDTGAIATSLTLEAARNAGIVERELAPVGRVGGAGKGSVKSWTGTIALFELAGEKIANNKLRIDDNDYTTEATGVLVGLDYFLSHRIYVSRLQRQVYITWNGGPVFARGGAQTGNYDARYAALPKEVAKDDADALARRGGAALAAGNYPRALEDLNRACQLAPGVADYFYARARVHLAMRQSRPALVDLDEALRLDPALADARSRRAWLRTRLDDLPGALVDLTQLDAALPPSSYLRSDMASFYASFGLASEALRQYDLWISTHPKDAHMASVLNGRCWMRARLNIDLPLALEDCKDAVDREGSHAAYHDSLAWTYLRMGDLARATKAFDDAIKLEELPFSLYGRGLAQLRLKDTVGAERDLAAARKLRPTIDEEVRKEGFEVAQRPKASGS